MIQFLINTVQSILPYRCILCTEPLYNKTKKMYYTDLCEQCTNTIIQEKAIVSTAKDMPWNNLLSCFFYTSPLKEYIISYKYEKNLYFIPFFAEAMIHLLKERPMEYDYCIPIPLHFNKLRKRGFNQVLEITKYIARYYALDSPKNILLSTRQRGTQQQLGGVDRIENSRNIFSVEKNIEGKRILLVDDVLTTGITLASACSTLLDSGAVSIDCITLAINERGINTDLIKQFLQK